MARPAALCLLAVLLAGAAGCGVRKSPVNGVVTLDGQPVANASVLFMSEDGSVPASGATDAEGKFSLSYAGESGIPHGNYKVLVSKTKLTEGTSPGEEKAGAVDQDYISKVKAEAKRNNPGGPGGKMTPKVVGGKVVMPGQAAAAEKAKEQEKNSELPLKYATAETSGLTATVPAELPVRLELKSK